MIKGIDKLILKSNQSQDYTNLTYLLCAKMGANKKVTDYIARLLPILLSGRNSQCPHSRNSHQTKSLLWLFS